MWLLPDVCLDLCAMCFSAVLLHPSSLCCVQCFSAVLLHPSSLCCVQCFSAVLLHPSSLCCVQCFSAVLLHPSSLCCVQCFSAVLLHPSTLCCVQCALGLSYFDHSWEKSLLARSDGVAQKVYTVSVMWVWSLWCAACGYTCGLLHCHTLSMCTISG